MTPFLKMILQYFPSVGRERFALAVLIVGTISSFADTVSLRPVADTSLFGDDPNNNLGGELTIPAGATDALVGKINRGLIKFDVAGAIPAGASITSVSLTMKVVQAPIPTKVDSNFGLRRMLKDWGEGNKKSSGTSKNGAPATAGEATWNARLFSSALWSSPGAAAPVDFTNTLSATTFVSGVGTYIFNSSPGLVADVKAWLDNAALNFGWILRSESEGTALTNRRFGSREDPANAPVLTIVFQPPMFSCPADATIECPAQPSFGTPTFSFTCATAPTVTFMDAELTATCPAVRKVKRTWTATDACGNAASCSQTITVQDTTKPTIACPAPVNVQCFSAVPAPNTALVTANDACGTPTKSFVGDSAVTNGCVITITRTYRVTDACGNSATCTQAITVQDTTPPVITCPAPLSVQCFNDVPPPNPALVTATDNCGTPNKSFVSDGAVTNGCVITITRTYRAIDSCGNASTCAQTITVQDTVAPVLNGCPASASFQCLSAVPASATVTALDNCDGLVAVSFNETQSSPGSSCNNVITRTWSARDKCGNVATCAQTITVNDTTAPSIACPGPVSVQCFSEVPAPDLALVTATDNCSTPTKIFVGDSAVTNGCVTTITRTYRATDACGNAAACAQTITVQDTVPPTMSCPGPVSVQCFNEVPAPNLGQVSATDNCGPPVVRFVGDTVVTNGCVIKVTRFYRAIDGCDNSADCSQIITVQDTMAPVISCPPPLNVQCFADVPLPNPALVNSTDNCGTPTTSFEGDNAVTNGCVITITRAYKATDACGNSAVCGQTITVQDTVEPTVVSCPANSTIAFPAQPSFGTPSFSDICDSAPTITFADSELAADCPVVRKVKRTWTALDKCGNAATCSQTITVVDNSATPVCALRIGRLERNGDKVDLHFAVEAGKSYTVEFRNSLTSGSWLTLTNINPQTVIVDLVVSDSITASTQRFYRIRSP